ncbi:MAG: NAD(P)-dependent oxidoreductase [Clostridiales bacterium]|jgi:UDP-glucose 4-epimerase|nr:NAD(P)-dependent oxidoreductase [Clostridiales bacterium]
MDVFLTGGTGFIGSYVANELLNKGHKLTILARNPNKIPYFTNHPSITMLAGDLGERETIKRGLYKKDACVHIALGRCAMGTESVREDLMPAVYMFETAALMGVKKIIDTSSISTFGNAGDRYHEHQINRPTDYYGAVKAAKQSFLFGISQTYGVQVNIVSPSYTFGHPLCAGATMYTDGTLRNIVKKVRKGEDVTLAEGTGFLTIGVEDLAKIYSAVLESDKYNRRIFIGVGTEVITWEEAARMAIELSGSRSKVILETDGRAVEGIMNCRPLPIDASPIEDEFGYNFQSRERLRVHLGYLLAI